MKNYQELAMDLKNVDQSDISNLLVRDKSGWTIAHHLALHGLLSDEHKRNEEILNLADCFNITVGHVLARWEGEVLSNSDQVLNVKDDSGITVNSILNKGE